MPGPYKKTWFEKDYFVVVGAEEVAVLPVFLFLL
jgi:hypothetical protein